MADGWWLDGSYRLPKQSALCNHRLTFITNTIKNPQYKIKLNKKNQKEVDITDISVQSIIHSYIQSIH